MPTIFNISKDKYDGKYPDWGANAPSQHESGWSPTGYPSPRADANIYHHDIIEDFQRHKLDGYTVRELVDFDVISSRTLKKPNLTNPIHPIFHRNNWESMNFVMRSSSYPIQSPPLLPNGNPMWLEDPDVSRVMQPVLKLASAIISRFYLQPFFDALMLGKRYPIRQDQTTYTVTPLCVSFWRRASRQEPGVGTSRHFNRCKRELEKYLRIIQKHVAWGFMDGDHVPFSREQNDPVEGVTCCDYSDRLGSAGIFIFLNGDHIKTLLRNDLTSGEKSGAVYNLTHTVIHELTHAISFAQTYKKFRSYKDVSSAIEEPYFENCPISELGFECQTHILGGSTKPVFHPPAAPLAYMTYASYPSCMDLGVRNKGTPVLNLTGDFIGDSEEHFWCPLETLENLGQENFWNNGIRPFGFAIIHAKDVNFGIQVNFEVDWDNLGDKDTPDTFAVEINKVKGYEGRRLQLDTKIKNRVEDIYELQRIPPKKKIAYQFLTDLAQSSTLEKDFWEETQSQERELYAIPNMFELQQQAQTKNQIEEAEYHCRKILLGLSEAITRHVRIFKLLDQYEQLRGPHVIFRDRRVNILRWNRGIRRLLNGIISELDSDLTTSWTESARQEVGNLLVQLEAVRMRIFPPSKDWMGFHNISMTDKQELECWPPNFFDIEHDEIKFMDKLVIPAVTKGKSAREIEISLSWVRDLAQWKLDEESGRTDFTLFARIVCNEMRTLLKPGFLSSMDARERDEFIEKNIIPDCRMIRQGTTTYWWNAINVWMRWCRSLVNLQTGDLDEDRTQEGMKDRDDIHVLY